MDFFKAEIGIKVGLSPSKKISFICFNESLFEIMKNAFMSSQILFFVLKGYLCYKTIFCSKLALDV